jgi:hypothetical protein
VTNANSHASADASIALTNNSNSWTLQSYDSGSYIYETGPASWIYYYNFDDYRWRNQAGSSTFMRANSTGIGMGGGTAPSYTLDMQDSTGGMRVPGGTTAQRPTNAAGVIRWNSSNTELEVGDGSSWNSVGGGGATLITESNITTGVSSVTLTISNPTTWAELIVVGVGIGSDGGGDTLRIAISDDAAVSYEAMQGKSELSGDIGGTQYVSMGVSGGSTSEDYSGFRAVISMAGKTSRKKTITGIFYDASSTHNVGEFGAETQSAVNDIDRVKIEMGTDQMDAGRIYVYGIQEV